MTIDEFKSFIKGLAFFDENWHPSQDQWKHILTLIDNLKIPEVKTAYAPQQGEMSYAGNPAYGVQPNFPDQPDQTGYVASPQQRGLASGDFNNPKVGTRAVIDGKSDYIKPSAKGADSEYI